MSFHFPVMPRLFMALHMEDRFPIIDILEQTPELPENSQWALFLRNHDELTLEMVTDEDRDYMYSVYANDPRARINLGIRRRLAPLLGGSRRKIELLNSLLFSLPGTPVIYYGDEIGMGDNIYLGDRNGVRTPMQWSADRNAGFSRTNPQQLYLPIIIDPEHHYEAINVEAQQQNFAALLWWMKRLILLRKQYHAFGHGSIEFLYPENRKVLVFIRHFQDEHILVVVNLSRFVNYAELDLSAYEGMTPIELFGQTTFPRIGELPYFIILGPHSFYWFKLELPAGAEEHAAALEAKVPVVQVEDRWEAVFRDRGKASLERLLPKYLATCRWFGGKARRLRSLGILDTIRIPFDASVAHLARIEVQYSEGNPELYLLPLTFAVGDDADRIHHANPTGVLAEVRIKGRDIHGLLYDALTDGRFCTALLDAIARRRRFKGERGDVLALPSKSFRAIRGPVDEALEPSLMQRQQSNTSVLFGDRLILKVFRRLAQGLNPDLEIGRFLTEQTDFSHMPPLAGAIEYRPAKGEPASLAILQGLVANEGDAWGYTLDRLEHYYDEVRAKGEATENLDLPTQPVLDLIEADIPPLAQEAVGRYFPSAQLLGQRTGELHVALASCRNEPAFAPEPFTQLYRRSLYQSMRTHADKALSLLAGRLRDLPDEIRGHAEQVLGLENEIFRRLRLVLDTKITALRTRCHGDYHLGQVLYTGKDFVIIDFEGEPARSIGERRLKGSPLRDVAGMLRSFDYAAVFSLRSGASRPEDVPSLEPWARLWRFWTSVVYMKAYLDAAAAGAFLPRSSTELKVLLDLYLLEKATYELAYELNNRPDWVDVPMRGILDMLLPTAAD